MTSTPRKRLPVATARVMADERAKAVQARGAKIN